MPSSTAPARHALHTKKSLHFQRVLLPDGWADNVRLQISGRVFVQIDRDVPPEAGDERAVLGVPGLPNLHSHAFQRGMAGLTEYREQVQEQDSFWTWRTLLYRFASTLTPDAVEALSAQAFMEMLEAGFTRVGEFHYLHHTESGAPYNDSAEMSARIVAAAQTTGIGLTLLPVFYAHSGFGAAPPQASQKRFVHTLDDFAVLLERCRELVAPLGDARVGVAPHSLRAVAPEELNALVQLSAAGPIHLHIAEQVREVSECEAWSGQRPVAYLLATQPVDTRWCLVHATHMNRDETLRLARSGAVAGLCPITEANLGDGLFPVREFSAAGGAFGVGSDSNVAIAANAELRLLEYGQRLQERARNVFGHATAARHTGRALFDGAVRGGAQALGVAAGITLGAPADVIALASEHACFSGRSGDAVIDSWIFAGDARCIDRVWRAGERVVNGGQHRDHAAITARYRATLEAVLNA